MIILATSEDAEVLCNLVNSAYRGEESRSGWTTEADLFEGTRTSAGEIRRLLQLPGYEIMKYVTGEEIQGCVELHPEGSKMYLGMLSVRPTLQGAGIGRKLIAAVEAEARIRGCSAVHMTVLSVRTELLDWYHRCGYIETGERKLFSSVHVENGLPKQPLELLYLEKSITQ